MEIKTDTIRSKIQFYSLIVMLVVLLSFSLYTFIYFKTECSQSKDNPFVYAAKRTNATSCACLLNDGNILQFNQEKAWVTIERENKFIIPKLNVSEIEGLIGK